MNVQNIKKLIHKFEALKELGQEAEYDQKHIFHMECGTPACLLGHAWCLATGAAGACQGIDFSRNVVLE